MAVSYWGVDHGEDVSKAFTSNTFRAAGRLGRMKMKATGGKMRSFGNRAARATRENSGAVRSNISSNRTAYGIGAGAAATTGAGGYAMGRRNR